MAKMINKVCKIQDCKKKIVDIPNSLCSKHHKEAKEEEWLDNTDPNNLGLVKWIQELMPEFATNKTPKFHEELYNDLLNLYNPNYVNKYERLYEFICFREGAKDLITSLPTLTPNGWVKHGDLEVGDYVIGSNGKPTKVIEVHPRIKHQLFKLKTRDGREAICGNEHLWTIYDGRSGGVKRHKTVTTRYLREYLNKTKVHKDPRAKKPYKDRPFFIETVKPIEFNKKNLPIEPYLLGLLLGNGSINSYNQAFKDLGLSNHTSHNKFIPKDYLYSSVEDRIELLQGLIDTNGTIDSRGTKFSYTTVSKQLVNDFIKLVRSLGGTTTLNEQYTKANKEGDYKLSYRVSCRILKITPAKLPRKVKLWKGSIKTRSAIVSIEPYGKAGDYESNCITVEAEDGQYVTNDYLLTHNSTAANTLFVSYILANNGKDFKYTVDGEVKKFTIKEETIVIISQTAGSAEEFTVRIRDAFSTNERLKYYYNVEITRAIDETTNQWTKSAFKLNNCFVQGVGSGQQIRGKVKGVSRPTLVIADDIYSEGTVKTEEARTKTKNWWNNAVMNSIDNIKGKVIMLGTIVHDDTVLVEAEKNPRWQTKKIPLMDVELFEYFVNKYMEVDWDSARCKLPYSDVENKDERFRLQKAYFQRIQEEKDWKLSWPERINLYFIAIKFEEAVYNQSVSGMYQEYFHITKSPYDKIFRRDFFLHIKAWEVKYENDFTWIRYSNKSDDLNNTDNPWYICNVHFGIDLSGTGADDAVISVIATLADGKIFILHQAIGKWSLRDDIINSEKDLRYGKVALDRTKVRKIGIIDECFRLAKRYHPVRIKIGVAGEEEMVVGLMRQVFLANYDYTYIISRKQTSKDGRKEDRIYNTLAPYYETRMVYHTGGLKKLEYQLEFLGTSDHDDAADSLECAFYSLSYPSDVKYIAEENEEVDDKRSLEIDPDWWITI